MGRPRELSARGSIEAASVLQPIVSDMLDELENAEGHQLFEVFGRYENDISDSEALADVTYRANLQTNLAGQLFVRDVELERTPIQLAREDQPFVRLPFTEAIANFRSREIVSPEQWEKLTDAERFRSFSISRDVGVGFVARMKRALLNAMGPGGIGLGEFIARFREDSRRLTKSYLETVYRTTTATSYNAGRYEQQNDADVREELPFAEYITADDERVRDSHAALHGKVFVVGSADYNAVYPPNGYNCRCVMVSRDSEDTSTDIPNPTEIREVVEGGFIGSPAKTIEGESGVEL